MGERVDPITVSFIQDRLEASVLEMGRKPLRSYRDVDQAAEARMERLFRALLDAGLLVHRTGLGCLSTPMGEREIEEIAAVGEQALGAIGRG